jgi:hypothetical protein
MKKEMYLPHQLELLKMRHDALMACAAFAAARVNCSKSTKAFTDAMDKAQIVRDEYEKAGIAYLERLSDPLEDL